MKNYVSGVMEHAKKTFVHEGMRVIFGCRANEEVNDSDPQMGEIKSILEGTFANLPLDIPTLIGIALRRNGHEIKFDRPYHWRDGVSPIVSLEFDDTYGAFARFAERDPVIGDEFFYLDREMNTAELNELYCYLRGDDEKKIPYLNSIFYEISTHKGIGYGNGIDIADNNVVLLHDGDELLAHKVLGFYITTNNKVAVITQSSHDNEMQYELLRDFPLDEIKVLYDLFLRSWYSVDDYRQITDD